MSCVAEVRINTSVMAGIARICKLYGKMQIGDVMWVWDYHRDIALKEKEMTKEQWKASEKAKWSLIKEQLNQQSQQNLPEAI